MSFVTAKEADGRADDDGFSSFDRQCSTTAHEATFGKQPEPFISDHENSTEMWKQKSNNLEQISLNSDQAMPFQLNEKISSNCKPLNRSNFKDQIDKSLSKLKDNLF